jgi:ParB family chromosome partitioning protein
VTERRRGLGRGLGALIPTGPAEDGVDGPRQGVPRSGVGTLEATRRTGTRSRGVVGDVSRETSSEPGTNGGSTPAQSGADLVAVAGARFAEIPVEEISPNPRQPRQVFDEDAMAELVHSIKEIGLLQPVVVRAAGEGRYQLVMGERRWRATQAAGLATIPAIVRDTHDDSMLRDALLENLHRSDLNPLEEAAAYQQLLEEFGCTQDELAARIGRSRPQISNTLRLMKLPPLVQRRVAAGVLSAGHARALLGLTNGGAQERLAQRIVAEGLSVRAVEEIVALGGDEPAQDKKPRPTRPVAPRLDDIATMLSDRLETRVKVNLGQSKGKVTIEFASIDDLERIVGTIVPD